MADDAVRIRGYRGDDLAACRALWVQLTDWHRRIYESPGIGGDDPGKQFDEHLAKVGAERIWVAEVGGAVVGFTGMIPGEEDNELEPLVVAETHRGRGIGRLLTTAVIEHARATGVRYLKVRPVARNESAVGFFHAMGFGTLGHVEALMDFKAEEKGHWREGERLAGKDFLV